MRAACVVVILASLASGACAPSGISGTATPFLITSTLPPTAAPTFTPNAPVGTAPPTLAPIQGTTSTQLNVRGAPSSASPPIGVIDAYLTIQIRGKDPSGNWYQIEYPQGKDGLGWVTSQYVNVQNQASVPVVAGPEGAGPIGVITQQVNVRTGPGTDASSVGTLNARDVVSLTGKDPSGLWLRILFASSPDGKGWVAAGYVQAGGLDQLPTVGQAGQVIGTETPTGIPPTATPTPGVAPDDKDSVQVPAADVTFSPAGPGSFMYSSDLSAPTGDPVDWVGFSPYGPQVSIRLDCSAASGLTLSLTHDGGIVATGPLPACGTMQVLDVTPGRHYLLKLSFASASGAQEYVRYTVTIASIP